MRTIHFETSILVAALVSTLLGAPMAARAAISCEAVVYDRVAGKPAKYLTRRQELAILHKWSQPLKPGERRPAIITKAKDEIPDPEDPVWITMPDGTKKVAITTSGSNLLLFDSLADISAGGIRKPVKMRFLNENNHEYGKDLDPETGEPLPYVFGSAVWDAKIAFARNPDGSMKMIAFGGAMATNPKTGRPYTMLEGKNHTRQRTFFDVEFREEPAGSGNFVLVAFNPRTPLNKELPPEGHWVVTKNGKRVFSHGYGGGPTMLLNGDLYLNLRGNAEFVYETVVDQIPYVDPITKETLYGAGRTVIMLAEMDPGLTRVIGEPRIILDVFKGDGATPYKSTERNHGGLGPLVEGAHLTPMIGRHAIESASELEALRRAGFAEDVEMHFSSGEYYAEYGSQKAVSKGGLGPMTPVLDHHGEFADITAPLRTLFTWLGRPVAYYVPRKDGRFFRLTLENGKKKWTVVTAEEKAAHSQHEAYQIDRMIVVVRENGDKHLLVHGVARAWLPEGIPLDRLPQDEHWAEFNRQIIDLPIEEYFEDGVWKERIIDTNGDVEMLKQYTPRPLSSRDVNPLSTLIG